MLGCVAGAIGGVLNTGPKETRDVGNQLVFA